MNQPCYLRSGFYLSQKHVSITVKRIHTPGAESGVQLLSIRYGKQEKVWNPLHYPDVARMNEPVRRTMELLLNDRDNVGLPLGRPMPKGCIPFKKRTAKE